MGNLCFSGKSDRVGDQKKEKPGQEPSVEAKPVTEEIPVQDKPVQENPVQHTPVQENPVQDTPVQENPVQDTPVQEKPVQENPVQGSPVPEKPVLAPTQPASKPSKKSKASSKSASAIVGDHGNIQIINNSQAWKAKLEEAKNIGKIVVVDFAATWCGPCRLMSPIFIELSKKFENLIFLKVDVDEVKDVTAEWEVRAMPTFLFIKDGKQLDRIVGANKDELERKCNHYASTAVSSSA